MKWVSILLTSFCDTVAISVLRLFNLCSIVLRWGGGGSERGWGKWEGMSVHPLTPCPSCGRWVGSFMALSAGVYTQPNAADTCKAPLHHCQQESGLEGNSFCQSTAGTFFPPTRTWINMTRRWWHMDDAWWDMALLLLSLQYAYGCLVLVWSGAGDNASRQVTLGEHI